MKTYTIITKKEINENIQVERLSFNCFQYSIQINGIAFEARNNRHPLATYNDKLQFELNKRENYMEIHCKKDFVNAIHKIFKYLDVDEIIKYS